MSLWWLFLIIPAAPIIVGVFYMLFLYLKKRKKVETTDGLPKYGGLHSMDKMIWEPNEFTIKGDEDYCIKHGDKPEDYARESIFDSLANNAIDPNFSRRKYNEDEIVEEQIRKLKTGYIHFDCDKEMVIGKTRRVIVDIFKDEKIYSTILNKENVSEIKVGRKMKAKLIGNDFEITSLNSEAQVILMDRKTTWNWKIKPLKTGNKALELVVTASLYIEGKEEVYDHPIYTKDITVKVDRLYTLNQFWGKYWDKVLGIIFGSGLLWVILKICGVIK